MKLRVNMNGKINRNHLGASASLHNIPQLKTIYGMREIKKYSGLGTGHSKAGQWTDTVSWGTSLLESQDVEANTEHHDKRHGDSQAVTKVTG